MRYVNVNDIRWTKNHESFETMPVEGNNVITLSLENIVAIVDQKAREHRPELICKVWMSNNTFFLVTHKTGERLRDLLMQDTNKVSKG